MKLENKEAMKRNKELWNELAEVHVKSYDVDKLRDGGHLLDEIQVKELGEVKEKTMLHLQCHIGTDTLSWARLGAEVTGIDISDKSIEIAKMLSDELKIEADFVTCSVNDLKDNLDKKFDIVYTSQGVLCWLDNLDEWAELIAYYLKPGGKFYIQELHPFLMVFDDEGGEELRAINNYFHEKHAVEYGGESTDYSDENYVSDTPSYEWQWSVSDIINSLIKAGLKIEFFNEYDKLFYKAHEDMMKNEDGWWSLPENKRYIPLMFSLKAKKE